MHTSRPPHSLWKVSRVAEEPFGTLPTSLESE